MTGTPGEPATAVEVYRLCVFDLWLSCGHIATVAVNGWYPVTVACCDRLGGTILRGDYVPYSAQVEYVNLLSEHQVLRPQGTPREPSRLLDRRPRTDRPCRPSYRWGESSAGRYPARVGATWSIDGSTPAATTAG
ncbi:hypothetical protein AB0C02_32990 [Micromonospora sp. NPDC048999]|uniref:hypothetical protein n=1 Tax=Micromonospora sp. NPDC048999 TaxID=3155391 RepID=UPI00340963C1